MRGALWLVPYLAGLGILSYLRNFGGGLGVIPFGWDVAAAAALSVGVFYFAGWCRLPPEKTVLYVEEYGEPLGDQPTDDASM